MTNNNLSLIKKLSTYDGVLLEFDIQKQFTEFYDTFRKLTSKIVVNNGVEYRTVFLGHNQCAVVKLTLGKSAVRLIFSLQTYYVNGFAMEDGTVYSFSGAADTWLKSLGFNTNPMIFDRSYVAMCYYYQFMGFPDIRKNNVSMDDLSLAFKALSKKSDNFSTNVQHILIVLWCIVEGIRFKSISDTVYNLFQGHEISVKYGSFLLLAKPWTPLSVAAYEAGISLDQIAVYFLENIIGVT